MAEVLFNYKGIETIIQCNINDIMKDIIYKYISKNKNINKNIYFIYNAYKINEGLTFNQLANNFDKERKKMNILVNDIEKEENNKNIGNIIKSKEVICPDCNENAFINIKNYKLNYYGCKNGHINKNILFEDFDNYQKVDISKIKCDKCKEKSINNIYNNEFYICNSCEMKLCPLCKSIHDKNHNIINYVDKNYICKKHNEIYIKYCKECKENICMLCEKYHIDHHLIYLGDMIPNEDEILKESEELKNYIDKLKVKIEEINKKLKRVLINIEIYYKINKDMINTNYKGRNYYLLKNINEIKNNNKIMIKELKKIIEEENINKRIDYIFNIYDKNIRINKTEIYENGDKYIGEFKNNLRDGNGIMYFNKNVEKNIIRYEGEWKNGIREGKGKLYGNNGNIYEGDFKNGKGEGKGIYYYNNGNRYEGDFKNGLKEGKGIFYFKNGDKYEGDFKNDKYEGKGIFCYNNGDRYEGDFKNGLKEGKGIFCYNNGDKYEGDFKNDKYEGKGFFCYNNGDRYEGDFKNGIREGKGIIYYNNGEREMGDYLNNKPIGKQLKFMVDKKISIKNY